VGTTQTKKRLPGGSQEAGPYLASCGEKRDQENGPNRKGCQTKKIEPVGGQTAKPGGKGGAKYKTLVTDNNQKKKTAKNGGEN